MSSPITGFEPCAPVAAPEYHRLQLGGTDTLEAVCLALQTAMDKGLITTGCPEPQKNPETGQMYWRIKVNYPITGDRFALPGDFIVIGTVDGDMVSIELCAGPESTNVENRAFAATFATEIKGR